MSAMVLLAAAVSGCGTATVVRLGNRQKISLSRMVEEVKDVPVIFVGEIHDDPEHHELQEQVIRGVHDAGRQLAIGLEMFTARSQPELDAWIEGRVDDDRFAALYERNWKEPLSLYAPIFRYARANRIPLVGINVPRELIQEVMRGGVEGLPAEVRGKLPPDVSCEVTGEYLAFMKRVNAGHSASRDDFTHFCEAMMLWNSLMARNIAAYLRGHPGTVMVVLAGAGHARRKWGIPERLAGSEGGYDSRVILPELSDIEGLTQGTGAEADYLVEPPRHPVRRFLLGE